MLARHPEVSYPLHFPSIENSTASLTREDLGNNAGTLWILHLHNRDENLLTHEVINQAFKPALDTVEREWRKLWRGARDSKGTSNQDGSAALVITGRGKFFCGGLDFMRAVKDTNFFSATLNPLLVKLLTFPIPVIAAINGHSYTAGVMVALSCDYRVMGVGDKRNAWTCMTEVHMGAPWPDSFVAITNAKVTSPNSLRTLALEGARISPKEALELGIVDKLVPVTPESDVGNAVLDAAREYASQIACHSRAGAWGLIKKHLYRDTLEKVAKDYRLVMAVDDDAAIALARL